MVIAFTVLAEEKAVKENDNSAANVAAALINICGSNTDRRGLYNDWSSSCIALVALSDVKVIKQGKFAS